MAIPVASYGSNPKVAEDLIFRLRPEFDIVHITLNVESALSEIPALAAGDLSVSPSSGLGTNAGADAGSRKAPKAVIFGGGLTPENIAKVKEALASTAPGVKPVGITQEDIDKFVDGGPEIDAIAKALKANLTAALGA